MNHIYKNIKGTIILDVPSVRKSILDDIINALDGFDPGLVMDSTNWRCWIAVLDLYTSKYCRDTHGKVFGMNEIIYDEPPVHERCRCTIEHLKAIGAGFATRNGKDGADYWLKWYQKIPDYYITKEEAKVLGWKAILGNLTDVAPGKMIGGDIYQNRNGHLPQAPGRIWYEADINFTNGYRTRHRILCSNDGLIFVTYDHYETFVEIVSGEHTMNEEYAIKHFDLNFAECRYIGELYRELKKKLELPDWCGENLDALWDALTGIMYTPADISIMKTTARKDIQEHANSIVAVMQEAEAKYSEITVRILD